MNLFQIKSHTNLVDIVTPNVNECKIAPHCTSDRVTENHLINEIRFFFFRGGGGGKSKQIHTQNIHT